MSQVVGAFGLLDFIMFGPVPLGARFETYELFNFLIFQTFSGRGKSRITETADTESRGYGGPPVLPTTAPIHIHTYVTRYMV